MSCAFWERLRPSWRCAQPSHIATTCGSVHTSQYLFFPRQLAMISKKILGTLSLSPFCPNKEQQQTAWHPQLRSIVGWPYKQTMAYYTSPNILAQNFGLLLFSLATEEPFQKAFITVSGETEKKIASNFFPKTIQARQDKPSQDRVILTSQPAGTDVACALNTSDHSKIRQNKKKLCRRWWW